MTRPPRIVHPAAHGHADSRTVESYIKLSTEFRRGPLAFFSGAQLKVFLCVAFHEADDGPGATLSTILRESGLSKPTAIAAARFLLDDDHPFIKIVMTGPDGTRFFRVCKLAWCGKDPGRLPGNKSLRPAAKESLPPMSVEGSRDIGGAHPPVVVGTDHPEQPVPVPTTTDHASPGQIPIGAGALDLRDLRDPEGLAPSEPHTEIAQPKDPPVGTGKALPMTHRASTGTGNARTPARTREERNRIRDALWDLGIETEEAYAKILGDAPDPFRGRPRDYAHVTPEYVEDWLAHYYRVGRRAGLGPGYYRTQIREQRRSPYRMAASARAEYRAANDAEWEKENG